MKIRQRISLQAVLQEGSGPGRGQLSVVLVVLLCFLSCFLLRPQVGRGSIGQMLSGTLRVS